MEIDSELARVGFSAIGSTFRGEIYENCERFKLVGKAYEAMPREQDGHFQIRSAHHLKGPLKALIDPNVRIVIIIGATQVMKSVAGDIWIPFLMEHNPRNTIVFFEDDPKAKLFCDARLMDTIYHHPVIRNQIAGVDRHDATKTVIKLPSMMLKVCGLNDGNASSLSWPHIWISEAWQHGSDGLLRKAIKRADRFPNDCKILIESQAGLTEEDLHREASAAYQVPLTWACPHCGGRQSWEFSQKRQEEFTPLPRFDGTSSTAKPGTYAGMQFTPETAEDGHHLTIDERARSAYWECYHCGSRIDDTRATRQAIMDSYEQDYQITGPDGVKFSPRAVCFYLPKESARDNSFEDSAKAFLVAKQAEKLGNKTPIQDWYLQERAVFFHPKLTQTPISVITESYDTAEKIPDERSRVMSVDCQQGEIQFKTGKFWYIARAIDKFGNSFQLARGYAENWREWIDVQKRLKIPNDNVAIDGSNYLDEILDAAAANTVIEERQPMFNGKPYGKREKFRTTWKILMGNGTRRSFPHGKNQHRSFSTHTTYTRLIDVNGRQIAINILAYNWSNLSVKDHLHNLMIGGPNIPKFVALKRGQLPPATQEKEKGDLAYDKQMQNEYRSTVKGQPKWEEATPNVHYRDCECQAITLFDMGGFLGLPAAPESDGQKV